MLYNLYRYGQRLLRNAGLLKRKTNPNVTTLQDMSNVDVVYSGVIAYILDNYIKVPFERYMRYTTFSADQYGPEQNLIEDVLAGYDDSQRYTSVMLIVCSHFNMSRENTESLVMKAVVLDRYLGDKRGVLCKEEFARYMSSPSKPIGSLKLTVNTLLE